MRDKQISNYPNFLTAKKLTVPLSRALIANNSTDKFQPTPSKIPPEHVNTTRPAQDALLAFETANRYSRQKLPINNIFNTCLPTKASNNNRTNSDTELSKALSFSWSEYITDQQAQLNSVGAQSLSSSSSSAIETSSSSTGSAKKLSPGSLRKQRIRALSQKTNNQ